MLLGAGVAVTTGLSLSAATRARAAVVVDAGVKSWRRRLANEYFDDATVLERRALQHGLEVWEGHSGGYMIVHTADQTVLESSPTAYSPYHEALGDLAYLGPGEYFAAGAEMGINLLTGKTESISDLRSMAGDAADLMQEKLVVSELDAEAVAGRSSSALVHVKSSEVKSRVPWFGYILSSHIYPNNEGICGWVAGSILTRYWHGRSSSRKLLPSKFRDGSNMTRSPNFASYLRGSGGNDTWAPNLHDRLVWNAKKQGVEHVSSWAFGKLGVFSEVRNSWPALVFGVFPVSSKRKGGHAVVAYGETKGGALITHYGWTGYDDIVLNSGLVGSNTRFRLK